MKAQEIIQAAIPGADDGLCEHIIWGRTAFPFTPISAQNFIKPPEDLRGLRTTETGFVIFATT